MWKMELKNLKQLNTPRGRVPTLQLMGEYNLEKVKGIAQSEDDEGLFVSFISDHNTQVAKYLIIQAKLDDKAKKNDDKK